MVDIPSEKVLKLLPTNLLPCGIAVRIDAQRARMDRVNATERAAAHVPLPARTSLC